MGAKISRWPNFTFKYIISFVLPPGFRNYFSFSNATRGSRVMELQRSKANSKFVQGRKNNKSYSDFLEQGLKLFVFTSRFRKIIVCTILYVKLIMLTRYVDLR